MFQTQLPCTATLCNTREDNLPPQHLFALVLPVRDASCFDTFNSIDINPSVSHHISSLDSMVMCSAVGVTSIYLYAAACQPTVFHSCYIVFNLLSTEVLLSVRSRLFAPQWFTADLIDRDLGAQTSLSGQTIWLHWSIWANPLSPLRRTPRHYELLKTRERETFADISCSVLFLLISAIPWHRTPVRCYL
jgi:hypothetical protein